MASAGDGEDEEKSDEPKTSRDLQRGAVAGTHGSREGMRGSGSADRNELQSTLSEAHGSGQKTLTDSERKYKSLQDQITGKVQEKQSQIEARYEQAIASLKVNEHNLRSRVRGF